MCLVQICCWAHQKSYIWKIELEQETFMLPSKSLAVYQCTKPITKSLTLLQNIWLHLSLLQIDTLVLCSWNEMSIVSRCTVGHVAMIVDSRPARHCSDVILYPFLFLSLTKLPSAPLRDNKFSGQRTFCQTLACVLESCVTEERGGSKTFKAINKTC